MIKKKVQALFGILAEFAIELESQICGLYTSYKVVSVGALLLGN